MRRRRDRHAAAGAAAVPLAGRLLPPPPPLLPRAAAVHGHIARAHPCPSLFLRNSLPAAYCRLGGPLPARPVLDEMPRRNAVSFNLLIDSFSRAGIVDLSLETFVRARSAGVKVDRFTYAAALAACSRAGALKAGKAVHALAVLEGIFKGVFVSNSLISMYARCGDMDEARRVFEVAEERDDVSWNSLVSRYVRAGAREEMLVFALLVLNTNCTTDEDGIDQELLAEAETAWAQREWTIQHVLFPSMQLFLKHPKSVATDGTFVQVASLEKLYKILKDVSSQVTT